MKTRYKALIFDADHTLLDYGADERLALKRTLSAFSLPTANELVLRAHALSEIVWTENGLYDVENEKIQKNYHILYRSHVTGIFERLFEEFSLTAQPEEVGKRFLKELEVGGTPIDGAKEMLDALSEKTGGKYKIYIATNGVSSIQKGRLHAYLPYVDGVFISEEIGVIKPTKSFFEKVLSAVKEQAENCLMIGDSLRSDVQGANACKMDTCWFNPKGLENKDGIIPRFEIRALQELTEIL